MKALVSKFISRPSLTDTGSAKDSILICYRRSRSIVKRDFQESGQHLWRDVILHGGKGGVVLKFFLQICSLFQSQILYPVILHFVFLSLTVCYFPTCFLFSPTVPHPHCLEAKEWYPIGRSTERERKTFYFFSSFECWLCNIVYENKINIF